MLWSRLFSGAVLLRSLPALDARGAASTDSLQDVDPPQSGYLPNHNINPAKSLAISWKNTYNALEVFYAKPLVYTPPGSAHELVITVSNQNIIRVIDGVTGALIKSRTLDPPFQATDSQCGDIPNTVGITGTPIIDGATGIMYLFSKGYQGGATGGGTLKGEYKFYAINVPTLTDVSGFPIIIDGHSANNDHTRYFLGGTVLQRPSLAMIGNAIVGAFGGHCDNFNYTGMLVAVSKTAGVGVTNVQAMEASPGAPTPQALNYLTQGGGKAGIWMSGMGVAADTAANRVFFVTGNSRGPGQNGGANGKPASGKVYLSTLAQTVANFGVNPTSGALTQQDYFEPYNYDSLNGGDRDFGSSGVALLDPTTFKTTGVARMAVAGGKSGVIYVMNADNLGGFKNGAGSTDAVIQTITQTKSLFSGIGSYPLEGGYIYFNPSGDYLYAYKFAGGQFTLAGKSAITFAGKSVPTVTSLNGQPGTGVVWLADVNKGLVAYKAVPVGGVLVPITVPSTGGLTKDRRPGFGNARVYVTGGATVFALA